MHALRGWEDSSQMIFRSSPRLPSWRLPPGGFRVALLAVGCALVLARPAHAYLDPGSGSFLLQMLAGIILGAGVAVKVYWRKIRAFISSRRRGNSAESGDDV
jgi:hypothetical protein